MENFAPCAFCPDGDISQKAYAHQKEDKLEWMCELCYFMMVTLYKAQQMYGTPDSN